MKKVRGKKRKLRRIEQRLTEATREFPQTFYHEVYSVKLPASQVLIEALRPKYVELIARYFLNGATALLQRKPQSSYKLAVLLFPNNMWYSEIIVFEHVHVQAYHNFLARQMETGFWREEKAKLPITYSQLIGRQFVEDEREQVIICYSER